MVLKRCGELQPGMVIAKDVHTRAGLLLITSGEEIDNESIEKLKNNEVSFVFVKEKKDFDKASAKPVSYSMKRFCKVLTISSLEVSSPRVLSS